MVESGPAAGVIASAYLGETLGRRDILSFDMGGTTAKVGLIQDGQPVGDEGLQRRRPRRRPGSAACRSRATRCGRRSSTSSRSAPAAARSPGSTRAGCCASARRARAPIPGPVCYRRGGAEPTVTDANVVLGRLNPDYFLGGEIGLDVEGARARDRGALREAARPRRHRGGERDRRDRERGDGQRAPPDLGAARLRPARLRPRRLRRRRARCTRTRSRATPRCRRC